MDVCHGPVPSSSHERRWTVAVATKRTERRPMVRRHTVAQVVFLDEGPSLR
jgi:hypothetical protein